MTRRRHPRRVRAFRVSIGNCHAPNQQREEYGDALAAWRSPLVLLASEAHNQGAIPGFARYSGTGRRSGETAVYVRRGFGRLHQAATDRLSRDVGGYSHDRWVTTVHHRLRGVRVVFMVVHLNPAQRGAGARQNAVILRVIRARAQAYLDAGWVVVIGGDFNHRDTDRGPDTPAWLAAELGAELKMVGVDGLMVVAPKRKRVSLSEVEHRDGPGSPHPIVNALVTVQRRPWALR